jgi:hypothetical protein
MRSSKHRARVAAALDQLLFTATWSAAKLHASRRKDLLLDVERLETRARDSYYHCFRELAFIA